MENQLYQWVIYFNPIDAPGKYVVRRWACLPLPHPAGAAIAFDTLDEARRLVARAQPGLAHIERDPTDDQVIVEVWA